MLIHVGYEFGFDAPLPVVMLLKLYLHPSILNQLHQRMNQLKLKELKINPRNMKKKSNDGFATVKLNSCFAPSQLVKG